ncbi:serine/threonine-protein kinase [Aliikangiella sp. G2MR2-5]|uniref:serine/threonine protein kinase n=1 Tax=Aliikangiella sp. G2MR2-5 TaxID=2788943 RepID=UPI0018AC57A4|nr:serine/threonine-protein kinase [Aliikangiella sp. G2MR2-5]
MSRDESDRRQAPPKQLGRYRIVSEVGRGATAFVYKAYDPQLDRFLALKVLRPELADDKTYRTAFIKEARLAAQLTHPGIVTIFDVDITDNKPYIAMELLEGATLEQILQAQGKLNLKTVLAMCQQLSRSLNYAHKQGVVHRDIKPGNIVVLKDKKTVKVTDFGIAQLDDNVSHSGKRSDKVLGTPEYMAPEQVLGKPMDNRSDLYALGVVMFRMLMAVPPFRNDDLGTLFKDIVKRRPPEIQIEEEKVRDDVQDLIRKLLQKSPDKRFQSAANVTAELSKIQAKLGTVKPKKRKSFVSLRLRWTATMAGVVFLSMCISLAIVYFVQYRSLSGITFDYGRSIARMLAFESAEPMLLDDSVGLNAIIQESSKNEQLTSVFVMNTDNQIVASTDESMLGKNFAPPAERELEQAIESTRIYQRELENGKVLFDIEMPIVYSSAELGSLYVTFNAESMFLASKTTLITMLVVMMITLMVVFLITLGLARRTSKDFQRITQAINKLVGGRYDARLISERNDESGQLFMTFNRLAESIENKLEKADSANQSAKLGKIKKSQNKLPDTSKSSVDLEETIELNIEN